MTSLSNDFQRPSDAPPSYDDVIAENRLLLATLMTSSEGNHQSRNLELMRAMREEWRTDDVTTHGRRSNSDDEGSSPIQDGTSPTTTRITSNRRSRRKYFPHYTEFVWFCCLCFLCNKNVFKEQTIKIKKLKFRRQHLVFSLKVF